MSNIAPVLHAVKMNFSQSLVGVFLRLFDVFAERGDAQHAPAGADDFAVFFACSGVEDVRCVTFGYLCNSW